MAGRILTDDGGRALDDDANPISGCQLKAFVAESSTPVTLYTTRALNVAHTFPVVADSAGFFAQIWADENLLLDVKLYGADDVVYNTPIRQFLNVTPQGSGNSEISVDTYGAVGSGSVDDYAAIIAAQNALAALGGGTLLFTLGKTYKVGTAIPMKPGVTYKGTGRSAIDLVSSAPGAKIISTTSSIFVNTASTIAGVKFEDLFMYSQGGGGHIFDWSAAGLVAKVEIVGCTFIQANAAKSVINGVAAGGVFSIWMHDFDYQYATANSVPALKFASFTVNSVIIERFWSTCTTGATSGTHSIYIESTNSVGPAINCVIRDGVFEQPGGGSIKMLSCVESGIEDCTVFDLNVTPNNVQFEIGDGAGPPSNNCYIKGCRSTDGTTLKPDCKIDCSVVGQSAFLIEQCIFSYLDGGNATPAILIIGSGATNFQNIAYTRLGAEATADLHFGTTDGSSKSYTIWNGYSGNNQGYLLTYQNGAYKGAISPSGNWQWGGTAVAPNYTVALTGLATSIAGYVANGATAQLGFATGAGSGVTQGTNRTTGVTINTPCGGITLVSAAGTATWQSFTVTNSSVAATDTILVSQKSGTDLYMIDVTAVAAGSFRISFATTGGTTTEQPVFNFSVIKAVAA